MFNDGGIRMKHAIALTGGIATGKSTVGTLLKLHGYEIIDADTIAHGVLEERKELIFERFGNNVRAEDGFVNRKALGVIVFNDTDARKDLESIVHPRVREIIEIKAERSERKEVPYFIDIPLFFETKAYSEIEKILLIYAPRDLQITRLMKRDGFTQEEAIVRIDAQMSIEEKRKGATDIIENTLDMGHLTTQIETFRRRIACS